jgi:hypothetical protein
VLGKAHEVRSRAEYEGEVEVDDRPLKDLIEAAQAVLAAVTKLVERERAEPPSD